MSCMTAQIAPHIWNDPFHVRSLCILAHVDHGKTTLTDHLLAANGFVAARSAGHVRFMDSRRDEQERGITMKSSSVALIFQHNEEDGVMANKTQEEKLKNIYLIHVIDSPGHIDFSSEVATAVRLSDGAIVLVDVLEGVCVQTIAGLEQCWTEGVRPLLVLTKIDRMLLEVKMNTMEAYLHMRKLIEQVNAITATFVSRDAMRQAAVETDKRKQEISEHYVDYSEEERFEFEPEKGNVLFASAVDGWAFSVPQFSSILSRRLGFSNKALKRALWGDFFYNPKERKVTTKPVGKHNKPMFVSMILDNIWNLYETVQAGDEQKIQHVISNLQLNVPQRELLNKESKQKLQAILSRWLPLSTCVLSAVVTVLPDPVTAQSHRIENLWDWKSHSPDQTNDVLRLLDSVKSCDRSGDVLVYVSKMVDPGKSLCIDNATRPQEQRHEYKRGIHSCITAQSSSGDVAANAVPAIPSFALEAADSDETRLVGFARVFSGTLRSHDETQKFYIIGPSAKNGKNSVTAVSMKDVQLLLLMATDTVPVAQVPAGNVCGIVGLGSIIFKSATISSKYVPPMKTMVYQTEPIVRVSVEPIIASDIKRLARGLRMLNLADPNIHVGIQDTGEHVIVAAGELHLERCIRDLKERFAEGVQFRVSAPIVPFRETVIDEHRVQELKKRVAVKGKREYGRSLARCSDDDESNDLIKVSDQFEPISMSVEDYTPNKACKIRIIAEPLPQSVIDLLEKHSELLQRLLQKSKLMAKRRRSKYVGDCSMASSIPTAASTGHAERQRAILLQRIQQLNTEDEFSADNDILIVHRDALITDIDAEVADTELNSEFHLFFDSLKTAFALGAPKWSSDDASFVWSFGPKRRGNNILISRVDELHYFTSLMKLLGNVEDQSMQSSFSEQQLLFESISSSLVSGFQLAVAAGPLCEEPLHGVAFIVQDLVLNVYDVEKDPYGAMSGQVMSTMRDLCRKAFQARSQRLVEPMYSVELQCSADNLGSLYSVLNRKRGKVISDQMLEGTNLFVVKVHIPVAESFGFANDIRKKTGGAANPVLIFSHWETIPIDPFWIPTTEDELEEFGAAGQSEVERASHNLARRLIDQVRRRKGLATRDKTVEYSEKQRTLKK